MFSECSIFVGCSIPKYLASVLVSCPVFSADCTMSMVLISYFSRPTFRPVSQQPDNTVFTTRQTSDIIWRSQAGAAGRADRMWSKEVRSRGFVMWCRDGYCHNPSQQSIHPERNSVLLRACLPAMKGSCIVRAYKRFNCDISARINNFSPPMLSV